MTVPQIDNLQMRETRLRGSEKAAALMLVMGKDIATQMAEFFSPEELQKIYEAAVELPDLGFDEINALSSEFKGSFFNSTLFPSEESVNDLFSEFSPDLKSAKNSTAKKSKPKDGQPNQETSDEDAGLEIIRQFFETESAQFSAYMLGKLDPQIASKVLEDLERENRNKILGCFLQRREISPAVEQTFSRRLQSILTTTEGETEERKEIEIAAMFINQISADSADDMLSYIGDQDALVAANIKKRLFRFENVILLAKDERVLLFDAFQSDEISALLNGAADDLKESVLDVLSQRNRRVVEADLTRGNASPEASAEARQKVVRLAVELAKDGKLVLPEKDG